MREVCHSCYLHREYSTTLCTGSRPSACLSYSTTLGLPKTLVIYDTVKQIHHSSIHYQFWHPLHLLRFPEAIHDRFRIRCYIHPVPSVSFPLLEESGILDKSHRLLNTWGFKFRFVGAAHARDAGKKCSSPPSEREGPPRPSSLWEHTVLCQN